MTPTPQGSLRLFKVAGIEVFLHWSWFIVAFYSISRRREEYSFLGWNIAEYLALFVVVLLHEFGHSLACRQVGGQANRIVLWPLGGVAYVAPPPRPGATLWSIAAGPLVNCVLLPLASLAALAAQYAFGNEFANAQHFLWAMAKLNLGLLIFNLLPIYPLDGGQILRSLLWFFLGRSRSLLIAAIIGMLGVVGLVVLAVISKSIWLGVISVFIFLMCLRSLRHARVLSVLEQAPPRSGFLCPACRAPPPLGAFWLCQRCGAQFDTFASAATCPRCHTQFPVTACPHCGTTRSFVEWTLPPPFARGADGTSPP